MYNFYLYALNNNFDTILDILKKKKKFSMIIAIIIPKLLFVKTCKCFTTLFVNYYLHKKCSF